MRKRLLLSATILGLSLGVAHAQAPLGYPVTGLYIGAAGGFNIKGQESVKNLSGSVRSAQGFTGISTPNLNVGTNIGASAFGAIGWGWGNGIRTELEFDYRGNTFSGVHGGGPGNSASVNGSEQLWGPMVNVLYDFNNVAPWIVPYVGVGVGYQRAKFNGFSVTGAGSTVPMFESDTTKAAFAFQGILGADFPIRSVPGLSFTADYRIMSMTGTRTYNAGVSATLPNLGRRTGFGTFEIGHEYNNTFMFGIRYNFGVVPPPPPVIPVAAPAPAPTRSYLVFFDWDKATLSDRARGIVKEAADNSTHIQHTRIEVNGYTDTSGSPKYNQGLSIRRAQAVQAELIKDGVPQDQIGIQGFGDTHLLVPTGAGVREPQNRRVEIIIR